MAKQKEICKTETQTVFLVTHGDYAEYSVCAVFTEKTLAEKYVNSFRETHFGKLEIEECTLNPYQHELKKGYKPFFVRMTKGGDCIEVYIENTTVGFKKGGVNVGFDYFGNIYINTFAKDEAHAIKIANEKRVQLITENGWE